MATETSEFSYLPAQAAALGTSLPSVERITLTLPSGRSVSALRFGTETPEVTLLHGAGLNAHTWDTTVLLLQRPSLAVDLAGHGDSSWRDDLDYSPETLANDVIAALDTWTDRPQVLVGHSLGGLTAAVVAEVRPDLVRETILVDITPGIDLSAGPAILRDFYAGPTDFATRDELVDRAIAFGFGGSRPDTERGVFLNTRIRADGRVEWKHHFARLAPQTLIAHEPGPTSARSARHDAGWAHLRSIVTPLTLVRAERGFVSEHDARTFHERLPDASVVTIDATHNVQETAPQDLADVIRTATASAQEGM